MNHYLPVMTLFHKEVLRFFAASFQTLLAPIVTNFLFLFIFGIHLGNRITPFHQVTYLQFVVPGLVLMGIINNSFQNTASSLFFSRYIGNIVDLLVTPLGAGDMIIAYTLAAILRGVMVGTATLLVAIPFVGLNWPNPGHALLIVFLASFASAQLGIIAAIYSNSFETISIYTNFVLLPLTYLGGMFYPISTLPDTWRMISSLNPLYYLMEGFHYGVLGVSDCDYMAAFGVSFVTSLVLFLWAYFLLRSGKNMRI